MESKRVAIYARCSTRDKGQDTENQLMQLRAFCSTQGWQITREYVDYQSAKTGDRQQFRAMFDAASRREFDIVLFWALDRFSREGVLATLTYLQQLLSYGVGFRSFCEMYLDSCGLFRDAVISILATIARQERVRLSERVKAGLEKARARGRIGGRPRATRDIQRVTEMRAAGMSLRAIAAELNVSHASIHRLVLNSQLDVVQQ